MLEIKRPKKDRQQGYYTLPTKRRQFWRGMRTILIFTFIIVILLIAAVFIYEWYMSQHEGGKPASIATIKPTPSIQPHKVESPTIQVGVATQYLTNPVAPGGQATISIHTNDLARCTITVTYGKTAVTGPPDLKPQTADEYGLVQWAWTVPATTPVGTKTSVDVWCSNQKYDGHVLEDLAIQQPIPNT